MIEEEFGKVGVAAAIGERFDKAFPRRISVAVGEFVFG